jgi:hypothetical protein
MPADAGIQVLFTKLAGLDSGMRRNDGKSKPLPIGNIPNLDLDLFSA